MGRLARRVVFMLFVLVGICIGSAGAMASALGSIPVTPVGGNDYPWQSASMAGMSPLRFAYRNCTDYVAFQINKQMGGDEHTVKFDWSQISYGGNGNASAWERAAQGKFMVNDTPAIGSVAWWGGSRAGGYGHVALVTSVEADGDSITMDEYNTDMTGHFVGGHSLARDQKGWPQAFIHIADRYPDGTYLESETGNTYVTAGGAALLAADDDIPDDIDPIVVMQHQIDGMPTIPRDGTYLVDAPNGNRYTISNGKLEPMTDWSTMTDFSDKTDLVTRYLQPARTNPNPFLDKGPTLPDVTTIRVGNATVQALLRA